MTTEDDDSPIAPDRRPRVRRFARKVLLVGGLLHVYVGWQLLPDLPFGEAFQTAGGLLIGTSALLIPFGTLAHAFFRRARVIDTMVWAGGIALGWFSTILVLTALRQITLVFVDDPAWAASSALAVIVVSVLISMVGFLNARRTARVVSVDVQLDDLPAALDGLTIAQITDLHIGPTIKNGYIRRVVAKVNEIGADIVAITGDVVDGKVRRLLHDVAPLGELKARHGAFVVTGNHEYYSGADEWIAAFRDMGLRPLLNEHVVIEHDGARLVLAGVNDFKASAVDPSHTSDPVAALSGSPDDAPKVLLAHQPRSAPAAHEAGFDLQLSGHTHGGQFWPWNHFVRMQQPFTAGLHRLGRLWVYTSRGTGYWGPPKRFGAPSEITRIVLRAAV
ncbi:MAG: metallophosphoesterase [Rhodospirillales bacterium]